MQKCKLLTCPRQNSATLSGPRGWLFTSLAICPLFCGCLQTRITEPRRSAVEQLLISTAADRSLHADFLPEIINGKKVFIDPAYFESYDKLYVIGTIRDLFSAHGALLVAEAKEADIVVEPRSGALSTDSSSSLIGMPSVGVPIPLSGTFQTPELYLMKTQKLYSVAKLALFAYDQKSRQHLFSSGPWVGRASHKYYSFLGFLQITRTDIPEKKGQ